MEPVEDEVERRNLAEKYHRRSVQCNSLEANTATRRWKRISVENCSKSLGEFCTSRLLSETSPLKPFGCPDQI